MNAFTQPAIVKTDGSTELLSRLSLSSGSDDQVSEAWLQEALFRAPQVLSLSEVEPALGPLIPVCRELGTEAGSADLIFVTATGRVVLIETKLWRNPDARRTVVGQILDYAKELASWSYEDFDARAATAAGSTPGHLLRCVKARAPEADEAEFVDNVRRSLRAGDFLLLIVGDGIRIGAEALVAFLERFGRLSFTLGLLEVAIYRMPDGSRLIQPRILAKTETITRTMLIGPNGPVSFEQVALAEDRVESSASQVEWFATFWKDYLAKLRLPDPALMPRAPAKSTNQYFPMPPSGSQAWISAYIAQSSRTAGVYLTFARAFDEAQAIYEELLADRDEIETAVGARLSWERTGDKVYVGVPHPPYSDLNDPQDRERVTTYLAEMTARMIAVFRPRLESAAKARALEIGR
jgi:hypothetical protein